MLGSGSCVLGGHFLRAGSYFVGFSGLFLSGSWAVKATSDMASVWLLPARLLYVLMRDGSV